MSSLSQMLERRRAAEGVSSQACHTMEAQPASLLVTTASGESWVFPWTQLAVAHLAKTADRETLRLTFTSHEVSVVGANLAVLRDLVASLQLARVRPAPGKYAVRGEADPFVASIEITRHRAEPERSGAGPA